MTISEMHTEFKVSLDKVDSLDYPDILPEEIDIFINTAIERFINQRLYGNNSRQFGFEETQKRFDDLLTLVENFKGSPVLTGNEKPNGATIILPTNYWHLVEEDADIAYIDCNNQSIQRNIPVYPISHDRYNKTLKDPFNRPNENKILRLGLSGNIELLSSTGINILSYNMRYIKKPDVVKYGSVYSIPTINVDCNLPQSVHKEIIEMAIADCLEKIESNRVTIANQLLTKSE